MRILVTGGCGFIGSNFIRMAFRAIRDVKIVNLDKLTYAGNPENLSEFKDYADYTFIKGDICDARALSLAFDAKPDYVVNFAAESHVDRSIHDPEAFIQTDVMGTWRLLEEVRARTDIRFLQISTDEVYGDVPEGESTEESPLIPSSPYSASKAAGDMLVLSYVRTYGIDAIITRSSNNYGPYQYPEKLISLFTTNLLDSEPVPVYGDGMNLRDWIYVEDNCEAVLKALIEGESGAVYNIGASCLRSNKEIANALIELAGRDESAIRYVKDRPGHDRRYCINSDRMKALGWNTRNTFEEGLQKTFEWYRQNRSWWEPIKSGEFKEYYRSRYGEIK